jgi:hypothetical protein
MEEIKTIRESKLATPEDIHNADEVLRAYEEERLQILPGKVTYWFNGKQKTPFVENFSISMEAVTEWRKEEGGGRLWIEHVSLLSTYLP